MLRLDPISAEKLSLLLKSQSTTAHHINTDLDTLFHLAIQSEAYATLDTRTRSNLADSMQFVKSMIQVMETDS